MKKSKGLPDGNVIGSVSFLYEPARRDKPCYLSQIVPWDGKARSGQTNYLPVQEHAARTVAYPHPGISILVP